MLHLAAALVLLVLTWLLHRARRGERAADKAGEILCMELNELKEFAANQAKLLVHLEHCNYHLACQLYGKEQVDHSIHEADRHGHN